MPTLAELEAGFYRYKQDIAPPNHGRKLPDGTTQWGGFPIDTFEPVDFADADGIWLLCPKCYAANGGPKGTHWLSVYFHGRHAPDHIGHNSQGQKTRWHIVAGTTINDLQLSPSILLDGPGCGWHGFIGTNGVPPGCAQ